MLQHTYEDVKTDAALLLTYWALGGEKGPAEGAELITLMYEVDGQQHTDRVLSFALTYECRHLN